MARRLHPVELDQLMRSHRRNMWLVAGIVALAVLAIGLSFVLDFDVRLRAAPVLGVIIGSLLLIPHDRLLRRLRLTRAEGGALVRAEKERRNGLAAMPPRARARREHRCARYALLVAVIALAVLVAALVYAIPRGGRTVPEDGSLDPWFVRSMIAAIVAAFVAFAAFFTAVAWRVQAKTYDGIAEMHERYGPSS